MKVYSVGQVNNYIKNIVTQDYVLKNISIRGEVSNCKYHSLGHIYFSLKDETGSLPCVMFRQNVASGLKFKMSDGQAVVCHGAMGVYERDGRYQLYVSDIKQDGAGRLFEEFERLKQKLYEEGLFDHDLKKPIPKYPKRVGIVTAKTGAAIQDIMNIARRRNPYVELILYPAKVQGEGAGSTIVKGIKALDSMGLDTIIVGRGGGSMEDLWAFNEEQVARAIFDAKTPIISGVGHEVDVTLSDYAADLRAPTPSAACELAIPDIMSVLKALDNQAGKLEYYMRQKLESATLRLDRYQAILESKNPVARLASNNMYLSELSDRIRHAMDRKMTGANHRFELLLARLEGLSPMSRLVGGFGYIESYGSPVTSASKLKKDDMIDITLSDGRITARVDKVE